MVFPGSIFTVNVKSGFRKVGETLWPSTCPLPAAAAVLQCCMLVMRWQLCAQIIIIRTLTCSTKINISAQSHYFYSSHSNWADLLRFRQKSWLHPSQLLQSVRTVVTHQSRSNLGSFFVEIFLEAEEAERGERWVLPAALWFTWWSSHCSTHCRLLQDLRRAAAGSLLRWS